jgi:alpha-ketoglutaric semialdehyde dehydrogenase
VAPTSLSGSNMVGSRESREGGAAFRAQDPRTGRALDPEFREATPAEVDAAARAAAAAFEDYALVPPARRAAFLRALAGALEDRGDALLERAEAETALPLPRLQGERPRTASQARLFADLVEEGSWVDARIDPARPERKPLPRPDVRRMLVPLGPVAVFGASNFPLAFSVAGGDTVSALAAGCPVVVKAHPAHPGTSEMAARAVLAAAAGTGMPDGVFSLVHGPSPAVGQALVTHPAVQAVGFTGSFRGGKAPFDAAARREQPIPVFAEMGSANPVFVLPDALRTRGDEIARALAASVTLGCGQFCTSPGLTFVAPSDRAEAFLGRLGAALAETPAGTMVHAGIKAAYDAELASVSGLPGVRVGARGRGSGPHPTTEATAALLVADLDAWVRHERLGREIYGPVTLAVTCGGEDDLLAAARRLQGHLTATVHATERDLGAHGAILGLLARRVGRVVVNGVPTGVEVTPAMHHGGPWPATTDPRATSVGTAAILRFARPVCFQDVPDAMLPEELRNANPRGIWRLLDGRPTRDPV